MHRLVALLALATAATVAGPASIGDGQAAEPGKGNLIITHAATYDYPSAPNTVVVCIDGTDADTLDVGEQYFVEEPTPGSVEVTVFLDDAATCTDTPDLSATVPLIDGGLQGLVIGSEALSTFTYDIDCVPAGEARVLLAQGASSTVDVYAFSESDGTKIPLVKGLAPDTNELLQSVPAGTYDIQVVPAGGDEWGPYLGFLGDVALSEGTSTQIFFAGGGDGEFGGFTFQQGPEVCAAAEPPPEETTTTSTTAPVATAPGDAVPATPVSGTATFTG